MPSLSLHNKWCEKLLAYFNVHSPSNLCVEVNSIVDKGSIHDLGVRVPEDVTLDSLKLLSLERFAEDVLSRVRENEKFALAFYFHHVMDVFYYLFVSNVDDYQLVLKYKGKILKLLEHDLCYKLLQAPVRVVEKIFLFVRRHYDEIVSDMFKEKSLRQKQACEKLCNIILKDALDKKVPSLFKLQAKLWFVRKILEKNQEERMIAALNDLEKRSHAILEQEELVKRIGSGFHIKKTPKYKYAIKAVERRFATSAEEALRLGAKALRKRAELKELIGQLYVALSPCTKSPTIKFLLNMFLQSIRKYLRVKDPEIAYVITLKFLGIMHPTLKQYHITYQCITNIVHALGYPYDEEISEGVKDARKIIELLKQNPV